jgi:hypothetical protein
VVAGVVVVVVVAAGFVVVVVVAGVVVVVVAGVVVVVVVAGVVVVVAGFVVVVVVVAGFVVVVVVAGVVVVFVVAGVVAFFSPQPASPRMSPTLSSTQMAVTIKTERFMAFSSPCLDSVLPARARLPHRASAHRSWVGPNSRLRFVRAVSSLSDRSRSWTSVLDFAPESEVGAVYPARPYASRGRPSSQRDGSQSGRSTKPVQ